MNLPAAASPVSRLTRAAVQSAWNLPSCRARVSFWASEKVFRMGLEGGWRGVEEGG